MTVTMKKVGMLFWLVALLMYAGGFVALLYGGEFLGVNWMTWFWNALVVGVLTIGVKLGVLIMFKSERSQ